MAQTNVLLLSQIAGYVMGLILSFCIVVPMSMHQHEFGSDHCLLFSKGVWGETGQLTVKWASEAYCNYVITVGVFMNLVCCIQIYRLSVFMYKGTDSSFLSAFMDAVGCTLMCGLAVSSAIIVTLGFMAWCQVIFQRFPSCEDAAGQPIIDIKNISTKGFYIEMGTVQDSIPRKRIVLFLSRVLNSIARKIDNSTNRAFVKVLFGAWAAFTTWVGLAVFSTLKVCRYHQLENIQVSMYRERQRLVNESGSPTAPRDGRSTPPHNYH